MKKEEMEKYWVENVDYVKLTMLKRGYSKQKIEFHLTDSFLAAISYFKPLSASFSTFWVTCLRSDIMRLKRRKIVQLDNASELFNIPEIEDKKEDEPDHKLKLEIIKETLNESKHIDVLKDYMYNHYSYIELVEQHDLKLSTIKSIIYLFKQKCKIKLEKNKIKS